MAKTEIEIEIEIGIEGRTAADLKGEENSQFAVINTRSNYILSNLSIKISRDEKAKKFPLPNYETSGASGVDLRASEGILLLPGERAAVPTGLRMEIPEGYEAQVRPRSGIALKNGITIVNSPGTIDSDYRGEIKVIMINHGSTPFSIDEGDRIAQLIFAPVVRVSLTEDEDLNPTERGEGGFGSSGIN
jgi:dUTP pyrophosphatase